MSQVRCKTGIRNCQCQYQIELADGVYMCFVKLPAGEFLMGSRDGVPREQPVHRVVLQDDFYLGTTPVTQQQARVLTAGAGVDHKNANDLEDQCPAENINATEADACCDWLQQLAETSGQLPAIMPEQQFRIRLPTEAEWEYACRYGSPPGLDYHTGDGAAALMQAGWFAHAVDWNDKQGNAQGRKQPVAGLQPNPIGLYDMHGNVSEWCVDHYDANTYCTRVDGVLNPVCIAADDGADRVIRGGSWGNLATGCRAAYRFWGHPGFRGDVRGFRVGLFPVHSCQTTTTQSNQPSG